MAGPLDRLRALDSCAVSDALDTLGLPGATTGLRPLWAAPAPVVGVVRTVTAGPKRAGGPAGHIAASAIDAAAPDDVLVVANGGRTDVSCWGGILTLAARARGIGGVVIDGACRDIAESEQLDFPVFGRAVVPVSARGRIVQQATGEPIDVAGVLVHPGDYVLADRNGVVFVAAAADAVLDLAERITAREDAMAEAVRAGQPVAEVMHDTRFPTPDEVSPVTDSALDALAAFSCATVSDALDRIGVEGALHGIAPLHDGARLAGQAFTVRYVNAGHPPGTVGDYLDDVPPGQVVVLDNAGRTDATVWGDILTAMAHARGVGGTVIDGVCRDVARALDVEYPIYSRGRYMRTGKDRVEVSDVGRPVSIGGLQVAPGDLLLGDADGVVRVPVAVEEQVLEICRTVAAREEKIVADVLGGSSIAAARSRHGYHTLQRRDDASGEGS